MNMSHKPGKRLVSKSRYAANTGKKVSLSAYGTMLLLIGGFGMLCVCWITGLILSRLTLDTLLLLVVFVCVVGGGSGVLVYMGLRSVREAKQMKVGVPFTRANAARLPAPDSLVRASSEPMQEQHAVLLRAIAAQKTTAPNVQLVRPANRRE